MQLSKWVGVAVFILAMDAGVVNAIGLLGFEHQSVSHLSGTATLLGTGLFNTPLLHIFHLLGVLLSFVLGSSIVGYLLYGSDQKYAHHFDTVLIIESALLLTALWFLTKGSFVGHFFASTACGLQNALTTGFSGKVIRTTHVTGIFTDLGVMIGEFFHGESISIQRITLFLLIIVGFISGGTIGSLLHSRFQFFALVYPAGMCLIIAVVYRIRIRTCR